MKPHKILVINPADNPAMTSRIDATLETFRGRGYVVECATARGGPPLVSSYADVDVAAVAARALVAEESAGVFVIACYADPGLQACREATSSPVLGVGRSAALAALARADNFGVIAMSAAAIPRHKRALRQAGLEAFLVAERPLPPGAKDEQAMFDRLLLAGRALRDEDRAAAVVIGCAEFGALRAHLEEALGLPVIDPVAAAMAIATTLVPPR